MKLHSDDSNRFPTSTFYRTAMIAVALFFGLAPNSLAASTGPKIELADSRGNSVFDEITIGRSLVVGLSDATVGATYRFTLTDSFDAIIDEAITTYSGSPSSTRLFVKSNIGGEGCLSEADGGGPGGGTGHALGPYGSLAEAVTALDGLTLWFKAEVEVIDITGGPPVWSELKVRPMTWVEPDEAVYYWSGSGGEAQCYFPTNENVYLSVYNSHLENFDASRVFMFSAPDKDDWAVDLEFTEVRHREGCFSTPADDCTFFNGSQEPLPLTTTIPMRGLLPNNGAFLAIVRRADGPKGSKRYSCDRATEGVAWIKSGGQLTESDEGWGCPPCPD